MYSYDYKAFHKFANETGRRFRDIAPGERYQFLENEGLLEEFQNWEERKIYQMARNTAQKVRDINPNLSLGVLAFKEAWVVGT